MRKCSLGLAVALLAVNAGSAQAAARYKIKWLVGHPNLDYFEEAAASFKKTVETESRGDIAVEIVAADNEAIESQASPEIAPLVAKGEAQMGHSFTDVMGAVDPRLMAFEAPYLMRDYRHMEGVIEGPVGASLLEGLRARNLVGLAFTYSGGASGVATLSRPIRGPEDLKGLKVGVFGDAVNEAWLKSLGAVPVPIKHRRSSILGWARDGKLDAVVVTWRNFEQAALNRAFKHFSLPGSTYLVSVTYVNQEFFDGLPPAYRELLTRASQEAGRIERARTIELNEDAKRAMLAKGVRAVPLTEKGRAAFDKALAPANERIASVLGAELVRRIKDAPGAPLHPTIPKDFAASR